MDPQLYEDMARQEQNHWWFVARRAIMRSILRRLNFASPPRILDAGCGSGGNLPMLSPMGELYAFEMNENARNRAKARQLGQVEDGRLPGPIPFADTSFDLITLFDVLEHIEDDAAALNALKTRLAPGGFLLLNVPAFQWLFVRHDRLHHHYRRYGRREIVSKLRAAGLEVKHISFWNFFLFPIAVGVRLIEPPHRAQDYNFGAKTPPAPLNRLIAALVSSERFLIPWLRLPFGLSLMVLAQKPQD